MSHIDDWCPGCGLYDPFRMHAHRPENYIAHETLEPQESVQENKPMSKVKLTYRHGCGVTKPGTEIPSGQYFSGEMTNCHYRLFVRSGARVIAVEHPDTWFETQSFRIFNYRPVDLEITFSDAE